MSEEKPDLLWNTKLQMKRAVSAVYYGDFRHIIQYDADGPQWWTTLVVAATSVAQALGLNAERSFVVGGTTYIPQFSASLSGGYASESMKLPVVGVAQAVSIAVSRPVEHPTFRCVTSHNFAWDTLKWNMELAESGIYLVFEGLNLLGAPDFRAGVKPEGICCLAGYVVNKEKSTSDAGTTVILDRV